MTKITTIGLFLFCFTFAGAAISLQELRAMGDEDFPVRETVYFEELDSPRLLLLPEVDGSAEVVNRFLEFQPEISVEKIYRLPVPLGFSTGSPEGRQKFLLSIFNTFGIPEKQVGYTYPSATREKDVVLFEEAYICDRRGDKIENFSFSEQNMPFTYSYYQYVDEVNFSGTILSQTINIGDRFFSNHSINEKGLWFTIFPVMGKHDLRGEIFIYLDEEYFYIYNCSQVKKEPAVKKIGVPLHLPSMFGKRMDVMVQWLTDWLSH